MGPWYDSLLIANVAWPLLLCWQIGDDFSGRAGLQFWQVYFLTIPHRWITLGLVFLDREQFGRRPRVFLLIAAAVALFCVGIRLTTGALTCLLTIDYIWNAWHFASQHHGIYRIYSRRGAVVDGDAVQVVPFAVEKWGMRLFLLYVILRVAAATWPHPQIERVMFVADWVALAVPVWLVVRQLTAMPRTIGGAIYLVSVCVLYSGLLGRGAFQSARADSVAGDGVGGVSCDGVFGSGFVVGEGKAIDACRSAGDSGLFFAALGVGSGDVYVGARVGGVAAGKGVAGAVVACECDRGVFALRL